MPGHTHILDTFSKSTVSQSSLAGNARTHSQPGHIFREHCQPVQFGRKCQNTLTHLTHFQRALSANSVWQKMPGHTHNLDTFSKSTVSQSSWQKMPGHTHILDKFRESTVSQSSLAENAWTHSPTWQISREHCQPVWFGRKCLKTLTSWTNFQRALLASTVWQKCQNTLTTWTHF